MLRGMRHRELNERDAGFTLVELIVAMFVLTIVLVSLIGVQVSAMSSITEARKLEQATGFANESLEQLRAIPWSVLSQGLHSEFLTASGGDDNVSAGTLVLGDSSLDGSTLLVAGAGQQTGQWMPLFDASGSNRQTKTDPSGTGVDFDVRTYLLTQGVTGETGTLGAVVVVTWDSGADEPRRTIIESTIYPSGCGDNETNPFATSCEPYLESSASSGRVNVGVTATDDAEPPTAIALGDPSTAGYFQLSMQTASASSRVQSQQVDLADATVSFGGSVRTTADTEDPGANEGFAAATVRASNDLAEQSRWPMHVGATARAQPISAEQVVSVGGDAGAIDIRTRSDRGRVGTIGASLEQACFSGLAAGETCGLATVAHNGSEPGVGFTDIVIEGTTFQAVRESTSGGSNADRAWTGRFTDTGGTSAVGCSALTGTGCTAAGAERSLAPITIGAVAGGDWTGEAPLGVAVIDGGTCAAGQYTDSVRLELGPNQISSTPVVGRCGGVRIWNGTDYTLLDISTAGTSTSTTSSPVTWTNGTTVVTAEATVSVVASSFELPSGTCPDDACTKVANAGSVTVGTHYTIDRDGDIQHLYVTAEVVGPSARAAFSQTGAEDAS